MIRSGIRTLALLLALGAPLADASAAGAQTAAAVPATSVPAAPTAVPAMRANVTVTGDIVRIGDLVENAGAVATIPIFRSPDLGTRGAVSADRVVDAIEPYGLVAIDTRGLAEVVVTRASRAISEQEITASIARALAGHFGLGAAEDISVSFDRTVHSLQVEPSATGDLDVRGLTYDPRNGRFDVTFDLASSALLHRQPARFAGIAIETRNAVAVAHPVEHGEVLKQSDLVLLRRPKSEADGIAAIADAVGLSARRELRPGQPLHAADLMKPELVQRGNTVTIVYQAPGVVLTLRGQAQEAGALGDSIGVLNIESKRIVQGLVSGPGRVTINAVTTRLVDNAATSTSMVAPTQPSE